MEQNNKKLYRSKTDRKISGLCGGIAEYLGIDSTILRILWILIVVFTGIVPGVLAYIVTLFIVPEQPTV